MEENTIIVPRYIRTHFKNLSHTARWFYVCLLDLVDKHNTYSSGLRKLESETGISIAALGNKIEELASVGLIAVEKRKANNGQSWEHYHITLLEFTPKQLIEPLPAIPTKSSSSKAQDELKKVGDQVKRAQEAKLPATLIFGEWIATLEYFNWQCAYCSGPYEIIEHFIPLALGGGTTKSNCVPACSVCNSRKKSYHPFLMPSHINMRKEIQTVKRYLDTCSEVKSNEM